MSTDGRNKMMSASPVRITDAELILCNIRSTSGGGGGGGGQRAYEPGKLRWCPQRQLGQGPVSLTVFTRNSNSMETSPCHYFVAGHQIPTNLCTCHDSTAVVPCICSDHCIIIEVRVKRNFHRIRIAMEKPLVKRGPGNWFHSGIF